MNYINKKGFTLVELIVVITILAILATIGYISFLGYASAARDSTRVNSISAITRALEYEKLINSKLFLPENMIPVTLSGTIVGYQGDMGRESLGKIGIVNDGMDPLDDEYYTYFLSGNKSQILALLENPKTSVVGKIGTTTYANTDYSFRHPYFKGYGLGLLLEEDNTPIHRSQDIITQGEFDIFNPAISTRIVQSIYDNDQSITTAALFIGGQLSLNSKIRTTNKCPENFIPVPGNEKLGQPDFCIGKYEASIPSGVFTDRYRTVPGEYPLVRISNEPTPVKADCRGNGDNYHMMTIMEWLTIAKNIEGVDSNWSNGLVGSGYIIGGNNGNNTTGFDSGTILNTGPSGNTSQDSLRELTLSNGEKINDFIGNVWEIVKPLNLYTIPNVGIGEVAQSQVASTSYRDALASFSVSGMPSSSVYYSWEDITDNDYKDIYGPTVSVLPEKGMGRLRQIGNYVTFIGGDYTDSSGTYENGLYSIIRSTSGNFPNVGTRCAYSY